MNERIMKHYRRGRRANIGMLDAMRTARILAKWDAAERAGWVRLRCEEDEHFDANEGNCCCDDPRCSAKTGPAYGSIGEYRLDPDAGDDEGWEHGDSVWGHTGYRDVMDPWENDYIVDVMQGTLDALKAALADRCPECKGTGRRTG